MQVELLRASDETCVGRVDVDISSLPMRPAKGASPGRTGSSRCAPRRDDAPTPSSSFPGRAAAGSARVRVPVQPRVAAIQDAAHRVGPRRRRWRQFLRVQPDRSGGPGREHRGRGDGDGGGDERLGRRERSYDDDSTMNGDGGTRRTSARFCWTGSWTRAAARRRRSAGRRGTGELSLEILSMRGVTPSARGTGAARGAAGDGRVLGAPSGGGGGGRRRSRAPAGVAPRDRCCRVRPRGRRADRRVRRRGAQRRPLGFARVPIGTPAARRHRGQHAGAVRRRGGERNRGKSRFAPGTRRRRRRRRSSSRTWRRRCPGRRARTAPSRAWARASSPASRAACGSRASTRRSRSRRARRRCRASMAVAMLRARVARGSACAGRAKKSGLKSAKNIKACVVRVAAALDPFHLEDDVDPRRA